MAQAFSSCFLVDVLHKLEVEVDLQHALYQLLNTLLRRKTSICTFCCLEMDPAAQDFQHRLARAQRQNSQDQAEFLRNLMEGMETGSSNLACTVGKCLTFREAAS